MIQELIILSLFSGALFYLGRKFYKTFTAKSSCEECACSSIDVKKIEEQMKAMKPAAK
jgi:hypothetical protein